MPELPEVETLRRQLAPRLEGRTIVRAEVLDPRWTRPEPPAAVEAELRGAVVERIARSGKYLVWSLSADRYLLMHLRMTGVLLFDPVAEPPHTSVRFELDDGHRLIYVDPRRFGTGLVLVGAAARDDYLAQRLGPEPFTPEFTADYLRRAARGRTAPVKSFLLDQRRIAGLGNIYADEALFRAGIHPLMPAGRLTSAQWARLRDAIEGAMSAGIDAKGASIDDFRHIDGALGSFQDQFLVHRRAGQPCPNGEGTIRKIVVGGRGTYVCERCQPRPRAGRPAKLAAGRAAARRRAEGRAAARRRAAARV